MHKLLPLFCGLLLGLLVLGCVPSERVSRVEEFKSPDHRAIYEFLEESKQRYNQQKDMDPSRLTKDARINTQYQDRNAYLSPTELRKVWPDRIETVKSHAFRLRSIEVEDISISGDTANVRTERTLVSDRWNTKHTYTFQQVFKKRNGEWKLHKSRTEPKTCVDCH